MHKLSICAIVKNEAPYLEEWLCYHIEKGVEHFYLYDNGSTDETPLILYRYQRLGYVTWEKILDVPVQMLAYNKFIKDHRKNTKWCAFIDVDEFIASTVDIKEALQNLSPNISVLAIHWVFFGSHSKTVKDQRLVIERFTRRAASANHHVKSIVKMSDMIKPNENPHCYIVGRTIINEHGQSLPKQYAILKTPPTMDFIWLNHYHTKSYNEYIDRKLTYPSSSDGLKRSREDIEKRFKDHDCNDIEDQSMLQFVPAVQKRIEDNRKIWNR